MTSRVPQETELTMNGDVHHDIIDDDIQHTVGRLLTVRPQNNNLLKGSKEPLESIISRTLQEERNQWKERLQLSMLEIDRQHRVILATQTGLQGIVKSLRQTSQKQTHAIIEEEEDNADMDQGKILARLLDDLKFQIKQVKLRSGVSDSTKVEIEERQNAQRQSLVHLKETIARLEEEKDELEQDLSKKTDKVTWLTKENATLQKQVQKLQNIVARYNENHTGAAFHLNVVETPQNKSATVKERETLWTSPGTTNDSLVSTISHVRERTYIEGDQMHSYPHPHEENNIIKERLKRNIYSVRKGGQRSTSVSQCLRCQALFKPGENNHKACRFHHKGREIKEKFGNNGKIEKVVYKWACCKKSLESPGCCFGYHV